MEGVPLPVVWEEVKDASSGKFYYFNKLTGETTWIKPPSFPYHDINTTTYQTSVSQPKPVSWEEVPNTDWQIVHTTTKEQYYFNSATNETTWDIPDQVQQYLTLKEEQENQESEESEESEENLLTKRRFQEEEENPPAKIPKVEEVIIEDPKTLKEFESLLEDHKINQFSFWDMVEPKLSKDPRFQCIPSGHQRKKIFEDYAKGKAKRVLTKREKAEKIFEEYLDRAEKDKITNFRVFAKKYKDKEVSTVLSEEEQQKRFEKRMAPFQRAEEEKYKQNVNTFKQLLMECKAIRPRSHWVDIKELLRKDYRYESISQRTREDLFYEYREKLRNEEEYTRHSKKLQEKKKHHREHLNTRRDFEEKEEEKALLCLFTEFITKPCSWEDAEGRLYDKERFRTKNLSLGRKKYLFEKHVKSLEVHKQHEFYELLKDTIPSIPLGAVYETTQFRLQNDARFHSLKTDEERKEIFKKYQNDLLTEAESGFRDLLRNMNTEITLSKSGPQFESALELVKRDPRWKALDLRSDRRELLLDEYKSLPLDQFINK